MRESLCHRASMTFSIVKCSCCIHTKQCIKYLTKTVFEEVSATAYLKKKQPQKLETKSISEDLTCWYCIDSALITFITIFRYAYTSKKS